jgi:hypothetical protein
VAATVTQSTLRRLQARRADEARPVVVAAGDEVGGRLRALQDDAGVRLGRRHVDGLVEQRLVGDDAAGLEAAGGRHDELRLGIVDARGKLARREAAEHHRMHRADARARQHGDDRLRHHRHVDDDAVALADAEVAQHRGAGLNLVQQLR